MRPLRLDLAGFAVFRETAHIDFTDADFFALVGPTGSGKSTVLDAIIFALYGTVPRWGDRRAIANALAPSCTEARVRLVFESAGGQYVVTRVIRRDGKGSVSTKHAGMEALAPGFDLSSFDTTASQRNLTESSLGKVLAGNTSEVDAMVEQIIGLPYEQFIKCVVLPQGEFAAFLHAKPAERQKIIVNLLGLDIYSLIRERANALASAEEAKATVAANLLNSLKDADDAAVDAAERRAAVLTQLMADIDAIIPELAQAHEVRTSASAGLARIAERLTVLSGIHAPSDTTLLAASADTARADVAQTTETVVAAEEREEKLRAELTCTGDTTLLHRHLDNYAEFTKLQAYHDEIATTRAVMEERRQRASEKAHEARERAAKATIALEAARESYQVAVATDRAAALRPHLRVGDPCPVCEHPVERLPTAPRRRVVEDAQAAGTRARQQSDEANAQVAQYDLALRDIDMEMAKIHDRAEQLTARIADINKRLTHIASAEVIRGQLQTIERLTRETAQASGAVRAARSAQRTATHRAAIAQERLQEAWGVFDTIRDRLAVVGAPSFPRKDLTVSWNAVMEWVREEIRISHDAYSVASAKVHEADSIVADINKRIASLFSQAGIDLPKSSSGIHDPARIAAVALERARIDHLRQIERRAEAATLRKQHHDSERLSQVARALAGHLRSDRFERWLLREALDSLVDGASRILRELSADQYELRHNKGEFFVIDHHDAGLSRAVRTLSGGETFQASLALALALAEQLAGMSTSTTSLESIVLDEGFGTLDASTLESVATTLENLAARGNRMVGVVTHVGALAERIPIRFEVRRDARSARVERVGL